MMIGEKNTNNKRRRQQRIEGNKNSSTMLIGNENEPNAGDDENRKEGEGDQMTMVQCVPLLETIFDSFFRVMHSKPTYIFYRGKRVSVKYKHHSPDSREIWCDNRCILRIAKRSRSLNPPIHLMIPNTRMYYSNSLCDDHQFVPSFHDDDDDNNNGDSSTTTMKTHSVYTRFIGSELWSLFTRCLLSVSNYILSKETELFLKQLVMLENKTLLRYRATNLQFWLDLRSEYVQSLKQQQQRRSRYPSPCSEKGMTIVRGIPVKGICIWRENILCLYRPFEKTRARNKNNSVLDDVDDDDSVCEDDGQQHQQQQAQQQQQQQQRKEVNISYSFSVMGESRISGSEWVSLKPVSSHLRNFVMSMFPEKKHLLQGIVSAYFDIVTIKGKHNALLFAVRSSKTLETKTDPTTLMMDLVFTFIFCKIGCNEVPSTSDDNFDDDRDDMMITLRDTEHCIYQDNLIPMNLSNLYAINSEFLIKDELPSSPVERSTDNSQERQHRRRGIRAEDAKLYIPGIVLPEHAYVFREIYKHIVKKYNIRIEIHSQMISEPLFLPCIIPLPSPIHQRSNAAEQQQQQVFKITLNKVLFTGYKYTSSNYAKDVNGNTPILVNQSSPSHQVLEII